LTLGRRADHIGKVGDTLTREVLAAIATAPCSLRALAREAGVAHSLLIQVQQGAFRATPALAEKLAAALERWGTGCLDAARRVRAVARRGDLTRKGRKP
jgi:hypothetical protein